MIGSVTYFKRTRVCIESPLSGDVETNVLYADACLLDSYLRGEAPFMGHLLGPRVLNDQVPIDREMGMGAHLEWLRVAELIVSYVDLGESPGMVEARKLAQTLRIEWGARRIGDHWREWILERRRETPGFVRGVAL